MKMYKPNGQEIEVNENSKKHALSIGWTTSKAKKPVVKKPVAKKAVTKKAK